MPFGTPCDCRVLSGSGIGKNSIAVAGTLRRLASMIKPARLEKGMTIGVIAPSGAIRNKEQLDLGIQHLSALGYEVREGKHLRGKHGFLAANDRDRLADFHWAFRDKKIDAIICGRGGYGVSRFIADIDYDLVRRNPKIFHGYSDITFIHLALERRCKLVTFHGPMVFGLFGMQQPDEFSVGSLVRALGDTAPPGSVWTGHPEKKREYKVIRPGKARGRLAGGNLSLLAASIGTPWQLQTRGRIVFIEEIEERPYRIDRMLTQLLHAGLLSDAAGIVIGRNVPYKEDEELEIIGAKRAPGLKMPLAPKKVAADYEQSMAEVVAERLYPLGIPVALGLPFGHIDQNATLPMGVMASMDSAKGELVIEESGVK